MACCRSDCFYGLGGSCGMCKTCKSSDEKMTKDNYLPMDSLCKEGVSRDTFFQSEENSVCPEED